MFIEWKRSNRLVGLIYSKDIYPNQRKEMMCLKNNLMAIVMFLGNLKLLQIDL